MGAKGMDRRHFLKVSGAAAAVAGGGIEGILAARQAPAWAQGTKLHVVRWNDFIPEADKWLKEQGGLAAMGERNRAKASLLYGAIDQSGGYYRNPVEPSSRSRMNVPFTLHDSALDGDFLAESEAAGLLALKGHKAVGGMRASLYNAVPLEAVQALVAFMADFADTRRRLMH